MPGPVGFVGLGTMGEPMASCLARTGVELVVWNRTASRARPLRELGAAVADTPRALFEACDTVLCMLADQAALDEVLGRGTDSFSDRVAGRTIVQMATTSAQDSASLARDLEAAGAHYVEAPVSGSRLPAERGELVVLMAGEQSALASLQPVLEAMASEVIPCGAVPAAMTMKLAVNCHLMGLMGSLAEATELARRGGVDLALFRRILEGGPMANGVMQAKLPKLIERDYSPHASVANVHLNARIIVETAASLGAPTPILEHCVDLLRRAEALGHGEEDVAAMQEAYQPESD